MVGGGSDHKSRGCGDSRNLASSKTWRQESGVAASNDGGCADFRAT